MLTELERIEEEEFKLVPSKSFMPDKSTSNPWNSFYLYDKRVKHKWANRKKYPNYKEFREDFLGEKGRFGTAPFKNSKHKIFWRSVVV